MQASYGTIAGRHVRLAVILTTVAMSILGTVAVSAAPYPRPRLIQIASVDIQGNQGPGHSFYAASMTADGRSIAFASKNSLVPEDTNEYEDIYVRDMLTGDLELISVAEDGGPANGRSIPGKMSPDGRYVVFSSRASNLAPGSANPFCGNSPSTGPPNECEDVFLRDRLAERTLVASVSSEEVLGNRHSEYPTVTPDGRHVAFASCAKNLVPNDTHPNEFVCDVDIFVRDVVAGTTERVNVLSDGSEVNYESWDPCLSADGRIVAFQSDFAYVPEDTNNVADVFVHDRVSGVTELVSMTSSGAIGDGPSLIAPMTRSCLSDDGRVVAFDSLAENLVPFDTNESYDSFIHDRLTGQNERVSLLSNGEEFSFAPAAAAQPYWANAENTTISPDGRFVAFTINGAFGLMPGSTITPFIPGWPFPPSGPLSQAYVHDRMTGTTELVSLDAAGTPGNGASRFPTLTPDGRQVAFASYASNLIPADTNGASDIFVHDRGPAIGVQGMSVAQDGAAVSVTGTATFSGATLSSASDPADDGDQLAEPLGAELTAADVRYRVENDDLLVRWQVASLPSARLSDQCDVDLSCRSVGIVGSAAVVYGLRLQVAGVGIEVRARRASATGPGDDPSTAGQPSFAVYRCDPGCERIDRLSGGFGTSGNAVTAAVPLSLLSAAAGGSISGLRAYTSVHEDAAGELRALDARPLLDATIPQSVVDLGVAPAGTREQDVAFARASLAEGGFSGTIDISGLPSGDYEVWARACLGAECDAASRPLRIT